MTLHALNYTGSQLPRFAGKETLGRLGSLEVRLAQSEADIIAAQEIRHAVFHGGKGMAGERDADRFDAACDHLLVIDVAEGGRVVGTYRLLRQDRTLLSGGFYSQDEFDAAALVARHPGRRFLELGRSCVHADYRSRRTIELLWQGIWAYSLRHGMDVLTGCASFSGTVPAAHAQALSFLHHHCRAEGDWAVKAVAGRHVSMDLMPAEAINPRAAFAALPPLIKAYLRLGAKVGDGCVIDQDFGTTDVMIVLPTEAMASRYVQYYGADASRFAA